MNNLIIEYLDSEHYQFFSQKNPEIFSQESKRTIINILHNAIKGKDYDAVMLIKPKLLWIKLYEWLDPDYLFEIHTQRGFELSKKLQEFLKYKGSIFNIPELIKKDKILISFSTRTLMRKMLFDLDKMTPSNQRVIIQKNKFLVDYTELGYDILKELLSGENNEKKLEEIQKKKFLKRAHLVGEFLLKKDIEKEDYLSLLENEEILSLIIERVLEGQFIESKTNKEQEFCLSRLLLHTCVIEYGFEFTRKLISQRIYKEIYTPINLNNDYDGAYVIYSQINNRLLEIDKIDELKKYLFENNFLILNESFLFFLGSWIRQQQNSEDEWLLLYNNLVFLTLCFHEGIHYGLNCFPSFENKKPIEAIFDQLMYHERHNKGNIFDKKIDDLEIYIAKGIAGIKYIDNQKNDTDAKINYTFSIALALQRRLTIRGKNSDFSASQHFYNLVIQNVGSSHPLWFEANLNIAQLNVQFFRKTRIEKYLNKSIQIFEKLFHLKSGLSTKNKCLLNLGLADAYRIKGQHIQEYSFYNLSEVLYREVRDSGMKDFFCGATLGLISSLESNLTSTNRNTKVIFKEVPILLEELSSFFEENPEQPQDYFLYEKLRLFKSHRYLFNSDEINEISETFKKALKANQYDYERVASLYEDWIRHLLILKDWNEAKKIMNDYILFFESILESKITVEERYEWISSVYGITGEKIILKAGADAINLRLKGIYLKYAYILIKLNDYENAIYFIEKDRLLSFKLSFQNQILRLFSEINSDRNFQASQSINDYLDLIDYYNDNNQNLSIEEMDKLKVKIQDHLKRIKQYPQIKKVFESMEVEEIINTANEDLIIYLVPLEEESSIFIIDNKKEKKIERILIPEFQDLFIRVFQYVDSYTKRNKNFKNWVDELHSFSYWLGKLILKPILENCESKDRVIHLISFGQVSLIPFNVVINALKSTNENLYYGIDDLLVTYTPSAFALHIARKIESLCLDSDVLVINNPQPVSAIPLNDSLLEISNLLKYNNSYTLLQENAANKNDVLKLFPSNTFIHLSSHGNTDLNNPLSSYLLMSNNSKISIDELFKVNIVPTRLVVLSACETGMYDTFLPNELGSMSSAFLQAGSAGVISSLWAVEVIPTAILFSKFYENLMQEKLSPPVSLRKAQIWMKDATAGEVINHINETLEKDSNNIISNNQRNRYKEYCRNLRWNTNETQNIFGNIYYWGGFIYSGT